MSLKIGIVGLPNVGKSTLFNALVKNGKAVASNYPFCTIEPNIGIVEVPDSRLAELAKLVNPEQIVPAVVEFVDIAGIIKGASKGEGLGNKFLSHIREAEAIAIVIRCFHNSNVHRVDSSTNPKDDLETIVLELILADMETAQKGIERYSRLGRNNDPLAVVGVAVCKKILETLEKELPASTISFKDEKELQVVGELQLLTAKNMIVVANLDETEASLTAQEVSDKYGLSNQYIQTDLIIPISAKLESDLQDLPDEDREEFLKEYNITSSGLNKLAQKAYALLNLETYFTAGPKEVRAWTIHKGWKCPQAAGVIHTDFEKGFIKAEVISYSDYTEYKTEQAVKDHGKLRIEGKEYIVQDGDVMHFRFSN